MLILICLHIIDIRDEKKDDFTDTYKVKNKKQKTNKQTNKTKKQQQQQKL